MKRHPSRPRFVQLRYFPDFKESPKHFALKLFCKVSRHFSSLKWYSILDFLRSIFFANISTGLSPVSSRVVYERFLVLLQFKASFQ